MKGIVIDSISKKVKYKFDTFGPPTLEPNEVIKIREDINDILAGADYNEITDTYTNPPIIPARDWRAEMAAANNLEQRVSILEQYLGLK